MTVNVLFLCPHSAAKSVAAAAFAEQEAARIGFDLVTTNGGVEPEPIVLPIVRQRLESEGLPVLGPPHVVTLDEMNAADVIVNIGCEVADLPVERPLREWQITNFSDNPTRAFAELEAHSRALVAELADSSDPEAG